MSILTLQSVGGVSEWDTSYWDGSYWDGTLDTVSSSVVVAAVGRVTVASSLAGAISAASLISGSTVSVSGTLGNDTSEIDVRLPLRFWIDAALGNDAPGIHVELTNIAEIDAVLDSVSSDIAFEIRAAIVLAGQLADDVGEVANVTVTGVVGVGGVLGDVLGPVAVRVMPKQFGGVAVQGRPVAGAYLPVRPSSSGGTLPMRPL